MDGVAREEHPARLPPQRDRPRRVPGVVEHLEVLLDIERRTVEKGEAAGRAGAREGAPSAVPAVGDEAGVRGPSAYP